jgi:hypothetical protein
MASSPPTVWLVDTSVFLNILNVPGRNQNREQVLEDFKAKIENKDTFILPIGVILESGNHIGRMNNGERFNVATKFIKMVRDIVEGQTSLWNALSFPDKSIVVKWLEGFPERAGQQIPFTDHAIITEWEVEKQRKRLPGYKVAIWSLDAHLQGYMQ